MAAWYDKYSAIAGTSVYCDNRLVARDVNITLPELNAVTAELNAGGPIELPITGQTDTMEATITKVGVNIDIARLVSPEYHNVECRAAQDVLRAGGRKETTQIRAFLGAIAKTVPAINLEFGAISENEITFTVLTYKLYENNDEIFYIDKPNGIYRVNGRDYGSSVISLL